MRIYDCLPKISSIERPAAAVASAAFLAANTILAKRVYDVALPICLYLAGSLHPSYLDIVSYPDLAAFSLGVVATGIVSFKLAKMAYLPRESDRIIPRLLRPAQESKDNDSLSGNQPMSEISAFHDGEHPILADGEFIGSPKGASQ